MTNMRYVLGCKWIFNLVTLATLQATPTYFCDTAFWNNMCCETTGTDVTTKVDGVPGCTPSETKNIGTRSSSQQAAPVMWNRMFFVNDYLFINEIAQRLQIVLSNFLSDSYQEPINQYLMYLVHIQWRISLKLKFSKSTQITQGTSMGHIRVHLLG